MLDRDKKCKWNIEVWSVFGIYNMLKHRKEKIVKFETKNEFMKLLPL